jgi:3-ketosteroid 9alpha-monooxygenase subunit A
VPTVRLARSDDVTPGDVVAANAAGIELVVWRDLRGTAHVHDARCPHQWNHLAAVGAVAGCELVCTAHYWRFEADGRGSRRLSDGTREPMRDLRAYPTTEHGGWIEADLPA